MDSTVDMTPEITAPAPANRPAFWRYYRERDLSVDEVARTFGRSREWLRLITLPFDDPARRVPDKDDVEAIRRWSRGEIPPESWYPPAADVTTGAA